MCNFDNNLIKIDEQKLKLQKIKGPVRQLAILKVKLERFSHSFTKLGI